jgi:ferredoxin
MMPDEEGFRRPVVDTASCVDCGRCRAVCPILQESAPLTGETVAYAAHNRDEEIRLQSTSGGVFTLLSQWVLDRGGVVFGAAYNDRFEVVHCKAETLEDLQKFRGAKYAQSRLGTVFQQVRDCLAEDRHVLFSGTPCQIGGLVSFLGKVYEKLILVDLICHGVPSPKVWQHYVDYRSARDASGQRPSHINLRSKETGWPGYSIRFDYPDGRHYAAPNSQDPYLRGFVGNLYLRPSCYDCRFKGVTRQSDFTLGDYWGVWSQHPELHDEKGTSLVLLHTSKAKQLWGALSGELLFSKVNPVAALKDNPSAIVSSPLPDARVSFFDRYGREDFSSLLDRLCPMPKPVRTPNLRRVIRKVKRWLS